MRKLWVILMVAGFASSFSLMPAHTVYEDYYTVAVNNFQKQQIQLFDQIKRSPLASENNKVEIKAAIALARQKLKAIDFWLRYFEPIAYKKINGPLPVEWENEVFEKYEPPYRRDGSGLTLAELYLEEEHFSKDSLARLIKLSIDAVKVFHEDSITSQLKTHHHFFLCNRLYLLNLAAIYTTAFECPETGNVIPELRTMLADVKELYLNYNQTFTAYPVTNEYFTLYDKTITFALNQPSDFTQFDHYTFIKDYINPLFAVNQKMIQQYNVKTISFNDYTLNNAAVSIFDKSLYTPQNTKGIYSLVDDPKILAEIRAVGKMLFYDPILSGNSMRSCASCHKPKEFFTDTGSATSMAFDRVGHLTRNTPSLINVVFNHLLMLDGKHISLQNQGKDVITNPLEMGSSEKEVIQKVLSCKAYKSAFKKFLKLTPEENKITLNHIVSAITFYYRDFSDYYSPFDETMNNNKLLGAEAIRGFNLFMSKAQCATCHFVPQFNGVHPPYIGSEFEVLGTPADAKFGKLSDDKGRHGINPAFETMNAFRTGTVRNAEHTAPYMHNGVFRTLEEVIDFYDAGGGAGRHFDIANQTLSSDSLKLTPTEKTELISFIRSLNEQVIFEEPPATLPASSVSALNARKPGGEY